ncbi:MAG: aminotransferase class IV, partial [Candidatus Diapherotrites archaeon]|nr:aminotransferase class IV [Candidatus Diapherotrites archaeon]
MKYACFNGKIIEERDSLIAANSKANFFDFGVYESIKVEKGKAFHPELNIERLFGSAAAIGLEIKQSKEEILGWIDGLIKANKADNALLRVMVLGETEKEPFQIRIFALSFHFYPGKFYAKGAKAITFKGERYLPQAKTLNLLLNY